MAARRWVTSPMTDQDTTTPAHPRLAVGGTPRPGYHTASWDNSPSRGVRLTQRMADSTVTMAWEILDRMERAVAKVRDRLLRATAVLNRAGIPYAVVGGHAVASWV